MIDLDNFEIEYVPIINDGKRVLLAEGEAGNTILDAFRFRSKEIRRQGFVEGSWERFSLGIFDDYAKQILLAMEPRWIGFVARILGKIGFPVRFRSGTDVAFLLNMVQCEAHNEVARTALIKKLNG